MKKFLPLGIFLAVVAFYSIKAWAFPLWHDEMTTAAAKNFSGAVDLARSDIVPPFFFVINAAFKAVFGNLLYFQKLPHILAGGLWIMLFYQILRYFNFRRPLLLTLVPATSFILLWFAQDIHPYSYFILFSLVSLFYSYKIFAEDKFNFFDASWLIAAFLILPLDHYFAFVYLAALDLTLLILILLRSRGTRILKIGQLLVVNLFIVIGLVPWADNFLRLFTAGSSPAATAVTYRFDLAMVQNLLYKFSGGADLLSIIVFIFWLGVIMFQIKNYRKYQQEEPRQSIHRFNQFLILYLAIFGLLTPFISSDRFLFWRYFIFLIWPFFFILVFGLDQLLQTKRRLLIIAGASLLGILIISNLANSTAYLLAPIRFSDWQGITQFAQDLPGKEKLILHNLGSVYDLEYYPQRRIAVEPLSLAYLTQSAPDRLKNLIACCKNQIVYVHLQDPLEPESAENQEIRTIADQGFDHKKIFWASPYLDFLTRRKVSPFWNYNFAQGGYLKPIVHY